MRTISEFREKCIRNCINYQTATKYKSRNSHLTDDEVIEHYRKQLGYLPNQQFTLGDYCKANDIDELAVIQFIADVKDDMDETAKNNNITLTTVDYVVSYVVSELNNTDEHLCDILGIRIAQFKAFKRKHPEYTRDEIVMEFMSRTDDTEPNTVYKIEVNGEEFTLLTLCKLLDINYDQVRHYAKNHNISMRDSLMRFTDKVYMNICGELVTSIELVNNKHKPKRCNTDTFKAKCEKHGLNYKTVVNYRAKHPELTDNEVIEFFIEKSKQVKKETFVDMCKRAGVDPVRAQNYKDKNNLKRNLINIEAREGKWYLKSNYDVKIVINGTIVNEAVVESYNSYQIYITGENVYYLLYIAF